MIQQVHDHSPADWDDHDESRRGFQSRLISRVCNKTTSQQDR
jgi:hypothetical protein